MEPASDSDRFLTDSRLLIFHRKIRADSGKEDVADDDDYNELEQISRYERYHCRGEGFRPGEIEVELDERNPYKIDRDRRRKRSENQNDEAFFHKGLILILILHSCITCRSADSGHQKHSYQKSSGRAEIVGETSACSAEYRKTDSSQDKIERSRRQSRFSAGENPGKKHEKSLESDRNDCHGDDDERTDDYQCCK